MKKKHLIFILLLFVLCSEKAQSQSYIGTKSGVNIPSVYFTDFVIDTRFRTGYFASPYISLTYRYMHHPKIGIQMDLAYSSKGWQQNTLEFTNSFRTEINYIEMPVYMHWAIIGNKNFKFNIDLGFYTAYAISTNKTVKNDQDVEENILRYNIETDNKGDFGLVMGASLSYNFPFGIIQIEGGFKTGFANIFPRSYIKKENPAVSTNQVPNITISYLIPLSRSGKSKND
ncbi:PorT family protein [Marivirga sp. S37H4]|uniref:PorT family protein n=1 Tax=Marivirga aurantiaca TaxID=2802615 RepID=A0A934WZ24_9BACT|nr:porin family protein [Marivirga aurantiaca]MBK6265829.1 PorT family protein [Marivirga aurantiaca]